MSDLPPPSKKGGRERECVCVCVGGGGFYKCIHKDSTKASCNLFTSGSYLSSLFFVGGEVNRVFLTVGTFPDQLVDTPKRLISVDLRFTGTTANNLSELALRLSFCLFVFFLLARTSW